MANEQREFWSKVALKYDQVVDLQIGQMTRSMVRERVAKEGRLGKLAEFGEHSNRIHQGCESLTGRSPKAEGF